MAGSLRDQLLKAGLVDEKQVRQAEAEKRRQKLGSKGQRKSKAKRAEARISLAEAYAKRANEEKRERDRVLNAQREAARQRREAKAKLKQLVKVHGQNDPKADLARFFEWKGKIRKCYLTADQQQALNEGQLGIIHCGGRYYVVAAEVVGKVKQIQAEAVGYFAPDVATKEEELDEHYAQFQVPDDLMW